MSPSRRKPNKSKRPQPNSGKPQDMWKAVPALEAPQSIVPARHPAMLIQSLGDPPLPGQGAVAEHYLKAVVEEAAKMATALAAAAGVLGSADDDL